MFPSNGKSRIIITNISPVVENGKYHAKTSLNEEITISADIFCDGHDKIQCSVHLKSNKARQWKEFPMQFINNDHWEFVFTPSETGLYQYRIQGWVNHFSTWRAGLLKKFEAGQDITVDLLIGAEILRNTAAGANAKDRRLLLHWSEQVTDATDMDPLITFITGDEVSTVVNRNIDKSNAATSPVYTIRAERVKARFSTWYELFPRSASEVRGQHGTFKDVNRLLPHIAAMGFDVLYLPPIHPIGELKRKGKNNALIATEDDAGSPWAIGNQKGGHKAIHPQLGSLQDFKALVTAAKKFNIDIALDIAFQCAPDHPYVKEHPQWFNWRPDGSVQYAENPPKKYEDILPLNFETEDWKNLWQELKSIIVYWISIGITVFRVDNPHTKAIPFWEWLMAEISKDHPDVIFLAEAFTRPRIMERLAKIGFTQSYTYFTWRNTKSELEEYLTELTQTDMRYYFRPNFWPNTPDILPPVLTEGGENAHIMRLILAATMSSNYGLYGPVYEFGINTPAPGKEEYIDNEKYEIKHWNWTQYTRIKEFITRLNRIRKENTALQTTWNIVFAETQNEQVICYCKADEKTGNIIITVVNLDPHQTQSTMVKLPFEKIGLAGKDNVKLHDLISGDKYTWTTGWNYVELNPYDVPAHILKVAHNETV